MNATKAQEIIAMLEKAIDGTTLCEVLDRLSQICSEKAEHLRHDWRDERAAHNWDDAAKRLDRVIAAVYGII